MRAKQLAKNKIVNFMSTRMESVKSYEEREKTDLSLQLASMFFTRITFWYASEGYNKEIKEGGRLNKHQKILERHNESSKENKKKAP